MWKIGLAYCGRKVFVVGHSSMSADHKNESPVSAGQFVKTLTNYATNFIARCAISASCADAGLYVAFAVVLLQAVLVAVWGVL